MESRLSLHTAFEQEPRMIPDRLLELRRATRGSQEYPRGESLPPA